MRVTLDEVCTKATSKYAQKDLVNMTGEYPVFGASGFIKNIGVYQQEKTYVAVVKDGAGIGRTMLLPGKSSVIGTMQYLLPKENIIPRFLYYAVKSMHLEKYYTGATIPHIYFKDYKKETFDLPKDIRQKEIINILDKVELVIQSRKLQLKALDELIKSRFVEMFGDPVFNPKEWPIYELSKYIQFLTSGSRGWSQYFTDNGEYFITIKNVKNCQVILNDVQYVVPPHNAEAKRTRVQEGDLLISITADLGRTGVVTREIADHGGYINQHLTCVRLDRSAVRPLYVAFYMESEAGKRQFQTKNQSAVKAGLNFHSIKTLQIMVPPIELQDSFIVFVKEIHKSRLLFKCQLLQYHNIEHIIRGRNYG